MATDYEEFKPHQKLISDADRMENFKRVKDVHAIMQSEFDESTLVDGMKKHVSLFSLAVNQQQAKVAVHSRRAV